MENNNDMIKAFKNVCAVGKFRIEDRFLDWLVQNGFFEAPASTKYHGNHPGGLIEHSFAVYKRLYKLTIDNSLKWQREESPFIVGMFHDLCKIDQYVEKKPGLDLEYEDAPVYEYNPNLLIKGHGAKSVMLLSQFITLTEEEMLCIRYHMGAYGNEQDQKEEWAGFDMACKKYENVLYVHLADQLASKIDGI